MSRETRCSLARERAVAQLGSALEWGSRGRGFESRQPDFSNLPERLFTPKRFQLDIGVAGFPKERRNRNLVTCSL